MLKSIVSAAVTTAMINMFVPMATITVVTVMIAVITVAAMTAIKFIFKNVTVIAQISAIISVLFALIGMFN